MLAFGRPGLSDMRKCSTRLRTILSSFFRAQCARPLGFMFAHAFAHAGVSRDHAMSHTSSGMRVISSVFREPNVEPAMRSTAAAASAPPNTQSRSGSRPGSGT